jgi:nucleoside-triphosphatase
MAVKNWLLTGKPGIGKTTIIRFLVQSLRGKVGGFLTEEIREKGVRAGFRLRDLSGGEAILAHTSFPGPHRVGRYGVSIEAMKEVGIPALKRAIVRSDLIVIDEIGKMELFCPAFQQAILEALDSVRPVLGVLQERPSALLQRIEARGDTRTITVTFENRERLGPELLQDLQAHLNGIGQH